MPAPQKTRHKSDIYTHRFCHVGKHHNASIKKSDRRTLVSRYPGTLPLPNLPNSCGPRLNPFETRRCCQKTTPDTPSSMNMPQQERNDLRIVVLYMFIIFQNIPAHWIIIIDHFFADQLDNQGQIDSAVCWPADNFRIIDLMAMFVHQPFGLLPQPCILQVYLQSQVQATIAKCCKQTVRLARAACWTRGPILRNSLRHCEPAQLPFNFDSSRPPNWASSPFVWSVLAEPT